MPLRHSLFAIALVSLAALSCDATSATAPVPDITQVNFASSLGINLAAFTKTADGLYYQDSPAGTGTLAVTGANVSVAYTGYFTNGTSFDTSVGKAPIHVALGAGQVIAGWDEGIPGMKVGGTRKLIIPPSLGYGATAYAGIPANSILVFTVQLVSIP